MTTGRINQGTASTPPRFRGASERVILPGPVGAEDQYVNTAAAVSSVHTSTTSGTLGRTRSEDRSSLPATHGGGQTDRPNDRQADRGTREGAAGGCSCSRAGRPPACCRSSLQTSPTRPANDRVAWRGEARRGRESAWGILAPGHLASRTYRTETLRRAAWETVPGGRGPRLCCDSVGGAGLRTPRTWSVHNIVLRTGVWTPHCLRYALFPKKWIIGRDVRDENRRLISRGTRRNDPAAGRKRGSLERRRVGARSRQPHENEAPSKLRDYHAPRHSNVKGTTSSARQGPKARTTKQGRKGEELARLKSLATPNARSGTQQTPLVCSAPRCRRRDERGAPKRPPTGTDRGLEAGRIPGWGRSPAAALFGRAANTTCLKWPRHRRQIVREATRLESRAGEAGKRNGLQGDGGPVAGCPRRRKWPTTRGLTLSRAVLAGAVAVISYRRKSGRRGTRRRQRPAGTAASRQPDERIEYHARLETERAKPRSRVADPKLLAAGCLGGHLGNEAATPQAQTRLADCSGDGDSDRAQRDSCVRDPAAADKPFDTAAADREGPRHLSRTSQVKSVEALTGPARRPAGLSSKLVPLPLPPPTGAARAGSAGQRKAGLASRLTGRPRTG